MPRMIAHPGSSKPKGRASPRAAGIGVTVKLEPGLLEALDRFIAEDQPAASRSAALRLAFRDWAQEKGFLAPETD